MVPAGFLSALPGIFCNVNFFMKTRNGILTKHPASCILWEQT
jgi:hypothetical protein